MLSVLPYAIWSKNVTWWISDVDGPNDQQTPWSHSHTWWHLCILQRHWRTWQKFTKVHADRYTTRSCVQQQYMCHMSASNFLLWCYLYCPSKAWDQILQRYKLCKTFQPLKFTGTPVVFMLNQLLATLFFPGLAFKTTFLRQQITNLDWNPSTDQGFHCLKSWICNTLLRTTLAHTQPLVLQTEASEYGLGTALIQNNKPIALASQMLTDVETR